MSKTLKTDFNTLVHNIYKIATKMLVELCITTSCNKCIHISK